MHTSIKVVVEEKNRRKVGCRVVLVLIDCCNMCAWVLVDCAGVGAGAGVRWVTGSCRVEGVNCNWGRQRAQGAVGGVVDNFFGNF